MKKFFSVVAAALIAAVAVCGCACSTMNNDGAATPAPTAEVTAGPTRDAMATPSQEPASSASPEANSAEPAGSMTPDGSAEPAGTESGGEGMFAGTIDGFVEGTVVDPADIPDIAQMLGTEFPEHTIQSVTHELVGGSQAYRITLQGDGELARKIYVFADGSILIPKAAD